MIEAADLDVALVETDLGGYTVDELLARLASKGTPFALASGYGQDGLPEALRGFPTLMKPFGRDRLVAMINSLRSR